MWPKKTEDISLDSENPATPVSVSFPNMYLINKFLGIMSFPSFIQGWIAKVERIKCPAPLPKDPAKPQLTEMLVPAPY